MLMDHNIVLNAGDTCKVILPSGKEIHLEVTQDTAAVNQEAYVLFSEEKELGKWHQTHPMAVVESMIEDEAMQLFQGADEVTIG